MKSLHLLLFAAGSLFFPSVARAQNDLQVLGDAVFTPLEIAEGASALYFIRFQNVFSDTVHQIVIRDTLDARLEANSFEMVDASHAYEVLRDGSNVVRWYFTDIELPDSASGGAASLGYILFSVSPKSFLAPGQTIPNRACYTFDQYPTMCSNQDYIWIDADAHTNDPVEDRRFQVVPNPNYGQFHIVSLQDNGGSNPQTDKTEWWITNMNGKTIWDGKAESPAAAGYQVLLGKPAPGLYLLWIKCEEGLKVEQFAIIR
ncbi:MAG: hypothetical protein R2792_10845 [Saprospiraceae bacterium]